MTAALYLSDVTHKRVTPRTHRLDYRILQVFLDLDDLSGAGANARLFSIDRFNFLSFYQRDRGDGRPAGLRAWVSEKLAEAGFDPAMLRVRLLTMPRILGWAFNPISVYYCFDANEKLSVILYEVDNTFGERHTYLIPVSDADGVARQECEKVFYVSPFLPLGLRYHFRAKAPAEKLTLVISAFRAEQLVLIAGQSGERLPLRDRVILRCFFSLLFQTGKVVLGIHWEALKLFLKGVKLVPKPPGHSGKISNIASKPE